MPCGLSQLLENVGLKAGREKPYMWSGMGFDMHDDPCPLDALRCPSHVPLRPPVRRG